MSFNLKLSDVFTLNSGMHFDKNTVKMTFSVCHISRYMMSTCLMIGDNFDHFVKVASAHHHWKVTGGCVFFFSSVLSNILRGDTLTLHKYLISHYIFVP